MDGRKSTWSVRLEDSEGPKGKGGNGAAAWTPWFCGEGCRDRWTREYSWNNELGGLKSLLNLMNTLEKTLVTYRNTKSRSRSQPPKTPTPPPPHAFAFLDTLASSDVSDSTIDSSWKLAESLTDSMKKPANIMEMMGAWNAASADDPTELLTEFEADCARFVLDGILRRALEEATPAGTSSSGSDDPFPTPDADSNSDTPLENVNPAVRWPDLLHLQNNEFQHIKSRPYMLGVFIRVYLFLKYVVHCANPPKKKPRAQESTSSENTTGHPKATMLETLEALLQTSDSVRAILARDHGNVFGIWEQGPSGDDGENEGGSGDDGEMFGWGMYVFGSYFNHGELCFLSNVRYGAFHRNSLAHFSRLHANGTQSSAGTLPALHHNTRYRAGRGVVYQLHRRFGGQRGSQQKRRAEEGVVLRVRLRAVWKGEGSAGSGLAMSRFVRHSVLCRRLTRSLGQGPAASQRHEIFCRGTGANAIFNPSDKGEIYIEPKSKRLPRS